MRSNKFQRFTYIVSIFSLFFIAACSSDTAGNDSGQVTEEEMQVQEEEQKDVEEDNMETDGEADEKNEEFFVNIPEPPTNLDDLVSYQGGQFAGLNYEEQVEEINKTLNEFPVLLEADDSEAVQQYWAKLVSLFGEDYPDPANIIEKWSAYDFGNPDIEDPKMQFKENYNVEIILDSSGSMGFYQGSKTRMELAKEAIANFAKNLPEEANVGLRVYGHEGTGSDEDKELSCSSNELVYDIQPYKENELTQAMEGFDPAGWTPLAGAIESAMDDLQEYDGETNTNIIYIVSDGIETCDGDPVEAATSLSKSAITPIVNVIGFDVDNESQKQLEDVAKAAEGTYTAVQNQEELMSEFTRTENVAGKWQMWRADAMGDVRTKDVERMEILRDFRSKWSDRWNREYTMFHDVYEYLAAEDIISGDVKSALYDLRDERIDMITHYQNVIWDTHYEIKEKESNEARDYIQNHEESEE